MGHMIHQSQNRVYFILFECYFCIKYAQNIISAKGAKQHETPLCMSNLATKVAKS